jgi:hypothetical protein
MRALQRGARWSADSNVDKTPHYTSGDAIALGCWCMGGGTEPRRNRCVDGSAIGNSPVMTRGVGAREDLGEDGPTGGSSLSAMVVW